MLRGGAKHHFLKSDVHARELKRLLGWRSCFGVPVAEDPEFMNPVGPVNPEYDVVAVVGSPPAPIPALEPFLEQNEPDQNAISAIVAESVRTRLDELWRKDAPDSLVGPLTALGNEWTQHRQSSPNTPGFDLFEQLENDHAEASRWLLANHHTYFAATEILWSFLSWQRTFILSYLARYFRLAVFGSDWSSRGIPGGGWVDYRDQAAVYARGKIAINISQGGEEEGASHKPFQIAASGVAQVHINRRGLADLFEPHKEIGLFDTPGQARAIIAELLADDARRRALGTAALARLRRDHTWEDRLQRMFKHARLDCFTSTREATSAGRVKQGDETDRIVVTSPAKPTPSITCPPPQSPAKPPVLRVESAECPGGSGSVRRRLRVATTAQLERAARVAGFDTYLLPEVPNPDFNRSLDARLRDGAIYRPFLEEHDIELVVDFNTSALTLVPSGKNAGQMQLTTAALGIPYVACYLDPITSTMAQVEWADHWHLLESPTWIKGVMERAHADELIRLGVPNVIRVPMAAGDGEYDTSPAVVDESGPVLAFMGHPGSSWFKSNQTIGSGQLLPGLTAAAVRADLPDVPFHSIYFDLYGFADPPTPQDSREVRARKAAGYYGDKFVYNAYLAVKQRDRFARFLKRKLGENFELIGDHWENLCGLKHTPRIWDLKLLHKRMRQVPVCLNMIKGNLESGLILRHFEITAHGGFMLTYPTAELGEFFEIGKECEVFHNEQELLEKTSYYLTHPDDRRQIALAGQRRTLAEHLYSHRLTSLVKELQRGGVLPTTPGASAPVTAPLSEVVPPAAESASAVGGADRLCAAVVPPECAEVPPL